MGICLLPLLSLALRPSLQTPKQAGTIYHQGWIDFDKNGKEDPFENPNLPIERRVKDLLARMTLNEKIVQMTASYGDMLGNHLPPFDDPDIWKDGAGLIINPMLSREGSWPYWEHAKAMNETQRYAIEKTRLGIPILFSAEGIKGVESRKMTCFSIPLGIGSTWDPDLARQVGEVMGGETRLLGMHDIWGPVLDVGRDPRWGRFEESLGEDPWLASRMGVAMVEGVQSTGAIATSKHFGPYGFIRAGREGDARMDPRATLREVEEIAFLPWRAAIVEGGLTSLMVAYTDYDGIPMHDNASLLQGRLIRDWGLKGFTISDADGMQRMNTFQGVAPTMDESFARGVNAGVDVYLGIEQKTALFVKSLQKLVKEGKVSEKTIDDRVRPILYSKFKAGLFDRPFLPEVENPAAIAKDHEVELREARESVVLLKNQGGLLPLDKTSVKRIAVIGPTADEPAVAHKRYGPYDTDVVTLLKGVKAIVPGADVTYTKGCDLVDKDWPRSELYRRPLSAEERHGIDAAVQAARSADIVICAVGDTGHTSGESRTRTSLDLPGRQNDLVQALVETGKPVVVVLLVARPTTVNYVEDHVPAVLLSFCPGTSGGRAVAEALFGDLNPGGKLNCTFPKSVGQLPLNFPAKRMGNTENLGDWSAGVVGPLYPFGYGLSYTSFAYSALAFDKPALKSGEDLVATFKLKNTGQREGDEVAQVYSSQQWASVVPYEKRLVGFKRVHLMPGEERQISITVHARDLQILDRGMRWTEEPGDYRLTVAGSSEDKGVSAIFKVSSTR